MDRTPLPRRPAWVALAWAVAWGLVAVAVYWSAVRTSWGQHLDEALLLRLHSDDLRVRALATLVRSGIPLALSVLVARLCVVAWRAGQRRPVVAVGVVLLVTFVLSLLLRDVLLTRPDLGVGGDNTLPSNHMAFTAALAGAVVTLRRCGARWAGLLRAGDDGAEAAADGVGVDGATIAASGRAAGVGDRKTVVVLAVLLVAEAVVNVVTYAHRPADPVAGLAVAAALWSLAWGVLGVWGEPDRRRCSAPPGSPELCPDASAESSQPIEASVERTRSLDRAD